MREPWKSERDEPSWGDPDAWRGEQPAPVPEEWYPDAGDGGVWEGDEDEEPFEREQQELPAPGWPEQLAGPEYWMYRRAA